MSLGERIAALRRERGLSQAGLAAATGVSRSAVAQWETDRAGQVSGNLSRIAQVLDVSVEVLLHGDAARPREGLTGDELALLRLYRACGVEQRTAVLRLARGMARELASGLAKAGSASAPVEPARTARVAAPAKE